METIVESLRSETPEIRAHATDELSRLVKDGLTVQEGLTALRGASHTFPPGKYDWLDSAAQLVGAASAQPVPEYIPVVLELYPTYNGKARVAALALLAKADSREAAEAWMSIVRTYARSGGVTSLPVGPLEQKPRYADVLFPEMLEYTDVESLATDIWHLCWTYCESGLLTSQSLLPYATRLVGAYRVLESALVQAQQSDEIGWMWDDTYLPTREAAGLLLDLMGYVPDPSVEEALRGALQLADPKPRAYAATSLVRLGKAVGTEDLLSIARSAEMRNVLHDRLESLGQASLFPDEYLTQAAFAESDMVNWLTFPTELGRAPDEIELMEVISAVDPSDGNTLDTYVFRFRTFEPDWVAKGGWMAGVAGPYLRGGEPATSAPGTFSSFETWDSKTADEHAGSIEDLLDRFHEYQDRNRP